MNFEKKKVRKDNFYELFLRGPREKISLFLPEAWNDLFRKLAEEYGVSKNTLILTLLLPGDTSFEEKYLEGKEWEWREIAGKRIDRMSERDITK